MQHEGNSSHAQRARGPLPAAFLRRRSGFAPAPAATRFVRLTLFGGDQELARFGAKEAAFLEQAARDFNHPKTGLVKELSDFVERICANGNIVFELTTILEDHRAMVLQAGGVVIEIHLL